MSFVGEVNRLGDHFVRPHDMEVVLDPDERTEEAMVQRIVALGFEIRVEFDARRRDRGLGAADPRRAPEAGAAREADRLPAARARQRTSAVTRRRPAIPGPRLPGMQRAAATQR